MTAAVAPAFLNSVRLDGAIPAGYPFDLPAVRSLPIEFGPVTVFVGDNGSGKSTLVEALAVAAGFNAEGGSLNLQFETFATHSNLHDRSHGQSFLTLIQSRFADAGLYILDEPDLLRR